VLLSHEAQIARAWHGHDRWCHTQASFDELAFLRLWHDWIADAQRPTHLHVVAHTAQPLHVDALLNAAAPHAELQPLARQLAGQCWGLLPGIHRLRFALMGDTPHHTTTAPDNSQTESDGHARLSLTWCVGPSEDWPEFADVLRAHPAGPCVTPADTSALHERTVTVIGSGIAGAGTARALAERGWQVTVLEAGDEPASGASGLPVGVVAPHTSHDDSVVSRLSRAGLRLMEQTMRTLLLEGVDWGCTGVRERRLPGKTRRGGVPLSWLHEHAHAARDWTHKAPQPAPDDAYWHPRGAWLRPKQLIHALLKHPNIRWQGHAKADALKRINAQWQGWQGDTVLAESSRVVLLSASVVVPAVRSILPCAVSEARLPSETVLKGRRSTLDLVTATVAAP